MQAAQQRQKHYYDAGRRDVSFSEGEEVLVNAKNIKLRRTGDKSSCQKLFPKFIGPFRIVKKVGKGLAYEVALPSNMKKVHPVFHVSLLKPYRRDSDLERVQPPPAPIECDGEAEYVIQEILDHRPPQKPGAEREFLVKWVNYGPEHDSWEPEGNLADTEAFTRYLRKTGLTPQNPDSDDEREE
jgi:hypothetical protein